MGGRSVGELGTIRCGTNHSGEPYALCNSTTPATGSFLFLGCEPACRLPSGIGNATVGYEFQAAAAAAVAGAPGGIIGARYASVSCAPNWAGEAVLRCDSPGAEFVVMGCSENRCVSGSGQRTGFIAVGGSEPPSTLVKTSQLGTVHCDTTSGYAGTAVASCDADGGLFSFTGCLPNVCVLPFHWSFVDPSDREWVVALKTTGDTTLGYSSPHWASTSSTLDPESSRTTPGNAKYAEYNSLELDGVRGCVGNFENCVQHTFDHSVLNAASLFGGDYVSVGVDRDEFVQVFGPAGQRDCAPQRPGFNVQCVDGNSARWGFCNNAPSQPCQPLDTQDSDGVLGFGLQATTTPIGAGWNSLFVSNIYNQSLHGRKQAWILIRKAFHGTVNPPHGYTVDNATATTVGDLGSIQCAMSFSNACAFLGDFVPCRTPDGLQVTNPPEPW